MAGRDQRAERRENDNYPTPKWAIRAILARLLPGVLGDAISSRGFRVSDQIGGQKRFVAVDPCCGEDGFIVALSQMLTHRPTIEPRLMAGDIRPEAVASTIERVATPLYRTDGRFDATDRMCWHNLVHHSPADLVITNPPYRTQEHDSGVVREIVERSLEHTALGGSVVMLLRLNYLSDGQKRHGRADWLRRSMPDVFVLDRRPSFAGTGKTDGQGYAAVRWVNGRLAGQSGTFDIIETCDEAGVIDTLRHHGLWG